MHTKLQIQKLCNKSNCKYPPTTLETGNQVDENLVYYFMWPNVCKYQIYSLYLLYNAKFSQVFNFVNFANFKLFAKNISIKIFDTRHSFHALIARVSMENILGLSRNSLQGDNFEVGIALLTAASSTGQQSHSMVLNTLARLVCHAHSILHVQHACAANS